MKAIMHKTSDHIKSLNTRVEQKTQNLREYIRKAVGKDQMRDFPGGLACPLEPNMKLYGVIEKECRIFSSSIQPMQLMFKVRNFSPDENKNQPQPELE